MLHAHPDDYSAPLVVKWFCQTCHSAVTPHKLGKDNNKTKLTAETVKKIKYGILKDLLVTFIMRRLHVSKATINQIRAGSTWRHI